MENGFDFLVFRLVHQRTKPTRTVTDKLKNLYYHLIFEVNNIFEHIYGLNLLLHISSVVACTVTKSQRSLTKKKNRHTYQCEESVEVFLLVYPKLKFHTGGDSVVGFSRLC